MTKPLLNPAAEKFITEHFPHFLLNTDQPMCEVPYYHLVPKGMAENLAYRRRVFETIENRPDLAREAWIMCARDPLFFINTFCWIHEPRNEGVIPFITYPFQDATLRMMIAAVGKRGINEVKSRDMGASWMALAMADWFCRFRPMTAVGVVSRNEDLVWRTGDSDTLLWKLTFLQDHTPAFLQSDVHAAGLVREYANGSSVTGWAATGNVGRGGRKLFTIGDESAFFEIADGYKAQSSLQHVTNTQYSLSTPNGASGAFYDRIHNMASDACRIVLHWSIHPDKQRGLYGSVDGRLVILDEDYRSPNDYPFVLDGKLRSPYYDHQCNESGIPWQIAQELDLDFQGSQATVFDAEMIRRVKRKNGRAPRYRGRLGFDLEKFEPTFTKADKGDLKVWCQLDANNKPHGWRKYVVGADIAAGTAGSFSSNSAVSVVDAVTGEEVASYACNSISPHKFAQFCVALCNWFGKAFLVWEANGPGGQQFTNEIKRIDYPNVYYRKVKGIDLVKRTRKPGFWTDADTKARVIGELSRRLESGQFISHDEAMLDECRQYVYHGGEIYHSHALTTQDAAGKSRAHGDRVIAAAMAVEGCGEVPAAASGNVDRPYPKSSMGHRLQQSRLAEAALSSERWWQ